MAYSEKVIDHYENPRNVGSFNKDDPDVGTGLTGAPACGDVMKLQIKVKDGIIIDAKFKTYGCLTSNAPVNTPTRIKKIKDLKAGDLVLAWDGNQVVNQKIRDIIKHSVDVSDLLVVSFQRETSRKNINPGTFSLICTREHIFWNAGNKPVEAQQLQVGQELYEITEHELRILTNNRHRTEIKQKNSARMKKWNKEIDQALPKVQNFIHNGMKIISISPITHRNQLRGCERDGKNVVVYDLKLEDGAHVFFTNRVGSHNCGSAIASSSLVTEWVKGKTIDEAAEIKNSEIAEELALPPVKIHCSILAEDSIKAAIADYKAKHDIAN